MTDRREYWRARHARLQATDPQYRARALARAEKHYARVLQTETPHQRRERLIAYKVQRALRENAQEAWS